MKKDILIRIYLDRKYLLAFRILLISISAYFLWEVFIALQQGHTMVKGSESTSNQPSFYIHLLKYIFVFLLFFWLGTGGAKEKK
jgi:hypothetical protein